MLVEIAPFKVDPTFFPRVGFNFNINNKVKLVKKPYRVKSGENMLLL